MAAMFFRLPKWHSTLRNFLPSSSYRNMSTLRCLKSRVRVPAIRVRAQVRQLYELLQARGSTFPLIFFRCRLKAPKRFVVLHSPVSRLQVIVLRQCNTASHPVFKRSTAGPSKCLPLLGKQVW